MLPKIVSVDMAKTMITDSIRTIETRHESWNIYSDENFDPTMRNTTNVTTGDTKFTVMNLEPLRQAKGPGCMTINQLAKVLIGAFHEEGHIIEFDEVFHEDTDTAKNMAMHTLLGRYMPEYRMATYQTHPAEGHAEKHALESVKALFETAFNPERDPDTTMEIEDTILHAASSDCSLYKDTDFASFQQAVYHFDNVANINPYTFPADRKALQNRLHSKRTYLDGVVGNPFRRRPSVMRQDLNADPELKRRYESAQNRAEQQYVMLEYMKNHPYKDILLFPNLRPQFAGVDLHNLPEMPHVKHQGRIWRENGTEMAIDSNEPYEQFEQ